MRMGVVVDATCDLAHGFVTEHDLEILPAALVLDRTRVLMDRRDPDTTLAIYRRYICDRAQAPAIQPMSTVAIRDLFLNELVLRYDRLLVLCMDARLSEFFDHATQASYTVLKSYRELRKDAGLDPSFAMRVLDTGTVGPGEAVLAHEALRALHVRQDDFDTARRTVQALASRIRCQLVAADLSYLRYRRRGGTPRLGARDYRLGRWLGMRPLLSFEEGRWRAVGRARNFHRAASQLLTRAAERAADGDVSKVIAMSFGGDPRMIRSLPAYKDLESTAARRRIDLHLAVMSATLAAQVGPGAFALAWSAA
ncbi:MAG: DegV family protein [Gammaproteobacteria bacterium]